MLTDFLPRWLGQITSLLLVGVVLTFAWRNRHAGPETLVFQWSLCLTLATTIMVIRFSPYNMVLLLPSVMLLLRGARHLWRKNWIYRLFCSITALTVFWSFLSAAVLVIALAFVPETIEQKAWAVPFYPIYIMPIMVYALLLVFKEVLCAGAVPKPAE